MRILVCGGRDYQDIPALHQVLDYYRAALPITVLGHGDARGADVRARAWARLRGIPHEDYPVDQRIDGPWPGAGMARNRRMFNTFKPDFVLGFPGGNGTMGMLNFARRHLFPSKVIELHWNNGRLEIKP